MRRIAVIVLTGLLAGCGSSPTGDGTGTATATLVLIAGGNQVQVAGYPLPDTITVQLRDGDGAPIAYAAIGASVDAALAAPFALVTSVDARTRADGTARFVWRLGVALGSQVLTITSGMPGVAPLVVEATGTSNPLRSLGGGDRGLCAVDLQGRLGCWDPLAHPDSPPRFVPIPGETRFNAVAVYSRRSGGADGCAAAITGRVWCFTVDTDANVGELAELSGSYPPLTRLFTGSADLDTNPPFCGLTASGAAWCWGSNADGVLGDQSLIDRASPVQVALVANFSQLAVGSYHACGVDVTKHGWCWGRNDRSQAGLLASPVPVVMPVRRSGTLEFEEIVPVTTRATCGVAEGGAWCWGDTSDLGVGSNQLVQLDAPLASQPIYVSELGAPTDLARVDGAVVAIGGAGLGAWWGDLSAVVDLVRSNAPRHFVRSLGLRSLVIPASRGLTCGPAGGADNEWLCGRMAALSGYPTHQPSSAFAGFGMPLP